VNIRESDKVYLNGTEIPREGHILLLGSIVRCDGNMTPEVLARISKAWGYYFTYKYIFENKYVSVKHRIRVWEKTVQMVLLWGLETASLTKSLRRSLDRCQIQMFARMARLRRHWPFETWIEFEKRKFAIGRYLVQYYGLLVSDRLLLKQFSFAGHLARFDGERWAKRVTAWLGCKWKHAGQHNQNWHAYDFQHRWALRGVRCRVELQWENPFWLFFQLHGENWWEVAQDKIRWRKFAPEFQMHYSLQMWDSNPPDLTSYEYHMLDFGVTWNENDAQHLMDFAL